MPYCYFSIGSALWLASDRPLELIAGVLLFFAGAQQWILRSNYRREDRIRTNLINQHPELIKKRLDHGFYPRWLYELLPFAYIGLGYQLANLLHSSSLRQTSLNSGFVITAALSLILAGYLVLALRGKHRLVSDHG